MENKQFPKWVAKTVLMLMLFSLLPTSFVVAQNELNKREWTDEEIIELGYIPDEVVVKFKEDKVNLSTSFGRNKVNDFVKNKAERLDLSEKEQLRFANASVLKLSGSDSVMSVINELKNDPNVEYAMPNYIFTFQADIEDYEYDQGNQWGLEKIQLEEAMDEMPGSPDDMVVAVLDTGLSMSHPEFDSTNLWDGADCVDENGDTLDDCIYGYDYVNDDKNPQDDMDNGIYYSHGTHVAGILAAIKNTTGIAGTSSNVKMMIVKVGNLYGTFTDVAKGINFAKQNNAKIINASFDAELPSGADTSALTAFLDDDHLLIAAAGNDSNDNDNEARYPASYSYDELIAVAATEDDDSVWSSSNYGATQVDIAAPGADILSAYLTRQDVLDNDFEGPSLDGMTVDTNDSPNYWGAVTWAGDDALYVDTTNAPDDDEDTSHYTADMEASIISSTIDLSGADDDAAILKFDVWCDTAPSEDDYLDVYAIVPSEDPYKLNSEEIDEDWLAANEQTIEARNGLTGRLGEKIAYVIPSDYLTSSTQIEFVWNTDSSDSGGPYRGCSIDNMVVETQDTDTYHELSGTSMATPFVTGVAAMIWGAYPNLTAAEVKQVIMDSGDYVADLDPSTGTHPIASGNRLNAYKALVMAEQLANGQDIILYPTIHSKASGYWSNASSWEENRVPNSSDIVEINGNISLVANETAAGVLINTGGILKPLSGTHTLSVTGDVVNNATIQDYSFYDLYIDVAGSIENNGTISNYSVNIEENLINTGTFSPATSNTLAGNLVNMGTIGTYLTLDGTSEQIIDSTGSIASLLTLNNDAELTHSTTFASGLTINSGKTLTFDGADTLTVNNNLINNGTITGGDVTLGGSGQSLGGTGTNNIDLLTFSGTGVKSIIADVTITGDVTVDNTITRVQPSGTRTMTITGNLENNSTIQNYTSSYLYLDITGNVENNGTVTNREMDIEGNLVNTGTFNPATNNTLAGNLTNSGSVGTSLTLDGVSEQNIDSTGTISALLTLNNDAQLADSTIFSSGLTINSGKTMTFDGADTLTVNNTLWNHGTISGGDLVLGGGGQGFGGTGTYGLNSLTLDGSGVKSILTDVIFEGDVTIDTGVTVQPSGANRNFFISGSLINGATIQDYSSYDLFLYLSGDLDNNGTMNNYRTYTDWESVGGADSYEFQYTNTSDEWQTEVSTGTNTYYDITAWETDDRRWRWRSIEDSVPSNWSSDKYIN